MASRDSNKPNQIRCGRTVSVHAGCLQDATYVDVGTVTVFFTMLLEFFTQLNDNAE